MKKNISLVLSLLLMTLGWLSAFLLGSSPYSSQGYWLIPALTVGGGIGLGLRFVSARKIAILLAVTSVVGMALVNSFSPDNSVSFDLVRTLLSGPNPRTNKHLLQVPSRWRTPPYDKPAFLLSPVSLEVSIYTRLPGGIDDFCFTPSGTLYASLPSLGAIYRQEALLPGAQTAPELFRHSLDNPTGVVCGKSQLVFAETTQIKRASYSDDAEQTLLSHLPDDGGHLSHRLLINSQGLLLTIGSRCDACKEANPQRASVQLLKKGGVLIEYARGLRDVGGMAYDQQSGKLWMTERSRLYPPPGAKDELNLLVQGGRYGWPDCDGITTNSDDESLCSEKIPAQRLFLERANIAGLMLTKTLKFPLVYRNSLLLVMQGDVKTKIRPAVARIPLVNGVPGAPVAFLGGWDGLDAMPSAIHPGPDGAIYISDSINGAIYRATWRGGH